MELSQLRTFITIAREGNLTRASGMLCLSQPAVSAQLKGLEDELGLPLFERTAKGMILTRAGAELLDEAHRALDAAKDVITRAKYFREGVAGEIRLGTISEPIALRLGEFLSKVLTLYPKLKIQLKQCISGEVIERVLTKELDAGYVIGDISVPGLSVISLAPITLYVVAPKDWKGALENADWSELAKFPWIGTSPKCSFTGIAERMFLEQKIHPTKVIEIDQESVLRNLVVSGVGLCLMRKDQAVAAESAGEIYIWPGGSTQSNLQFVYRSNECDTTLVRALLTLVHEMWCTSS